MSYTAMSCCSLHVCRCLLFTYSSAGSLLILFPVCQHVA